MKRLSDWHSLTPQQLEAEFNPRVAVPDFAGYFVAFDEASEAARGRMGGAYDLRYGAGPLQTIDLHKPSGQSGDLPVFVFIHGGYFRGLDKKNHSFVMEPYVAAGAAALNVNYDLCPNVTVDDIAAEMIEAVRWIWAEAPRLGLDRQRMVLAGHSAGATLAALILAEDWTRHGLPPQPFRGGVLVSGIYNLEPVIHVSVNAEIRLDGPMAMRRSPMRHPPKSKAPLVIAAGLGEPPSWVAESVNFNAICRDAGISSELMRIEKENHFSIVQRMAEPRHPLQSAALRLLGI